MQPRQYNKNKKDNLKKIKFSFKLILILLLFLITINSALAGWIRPPIIITIEANSSDYWDTLNTYNSTQMEEQSGQRLGIIWSWLIDTIFNFVSSLNYYNATNINTTTIGGDLTGTLGTASIIDNSHRLNIDNITNLNLTTLGGDLSGNLNNGIVLGGSHLHPSNNITNFNSSVSSVINDTTVYIPNINSTTSLMINDTTNYLNNGSNGNLANLNITSELGMQNNSITNLRNITFNIPSHTIYENSSCLIIQGNTSRLEIC